MPKIFISYRRDDSEHITGRMCDRLKGHFGDEAVFIDIDNTPLGVDFREHLRKAVGQCDILLAVIGDSWLDVRHKEGPKAGQRRLDDHGDIVRIEVQAALDRGIPVIPVLVGKATMPGEEMLPQQLQSLVYRNATEVRSGRDFHVHMDRLIRDLEHLAKHETAPLAMEPKQQTLADAVLDRPKAVRKQTLAILSALTETAQALGLAAPAFSLAKYAKKLAENTYQLIVVGEAKRGKSTFVNALIGRDILPTDVDIAASQVFRVCCAEGEAYRLRFEDDSQQEISAGDLDRFGAQVMVDTDHALRLDQFIRWIEIDVPARFLPANVRILDTPGPGALDAGGAQITHRFVPHADAVLFILDSQAPIGEPEVQLIAKLLSVTRSIFFVQTKIDLFPRQDWHDIQTRNQEILGRKFGDRLSDTRVWPISSINLRKAAQTGDEDYVIVSRYKDLAVALQEFLFRVAGRSRSADAILLAGHYQAQCRQTLAARLAALTEESEQKRAEFEQRAIERRKQFEADWGERGPKRRELLESIERIAALGKQLIRIALQPGGDIERHFRSRIEGVTRVAEIAELFRSLPREVEAHALDLLGDVRKTTEAKCTDVLALFAVAAEGVKQGPATDPISSQLRNALTRELQTGALEALTIVIPTILPEKRSQLRGGKQELSGLLTDLLQRLRKFLLVDVDLARGRLNPVDECFNSLERLLREKIGKLAAQKLAEAQEEGERLGAEARLDVKEREAKAVETRRELTDWDGIGRRLQEARSELDELERGQGAAIGGQASAQQWDGQAHDK